jgi:hypothetical protein
MATIDWGAIIKAAIMGALFPNAEPDKNDPNKPHLLGKPDEGDILDPANWQDMIGGWFDDLFVDKTDFPNDKYKGAKSGSFLGTVWEGKAPDWGALIPKFTWPTMPDFGAIFKGIIPPITWPAMPDIGSLLKGVIPPIVWPAMPDIGSLLKGVIPPITWPAIPDIGSLLKGVIPPISWPAMPDFGAIFKGIIPPISWPAMPDFGAIFKGIIPPISWPAMPDFGAIFKGIIPPITWPAMPDFGSILKGIIPPFSWPSIPSFNWPSIPSIDLGGWVSNLTWPVIPGIDLGGWVSNLQWPTIPSIDLGGWVANFQWPSVPGIDLGRWVANFVWPVVPSIDLGGWMSNFVWPSVPGIDLGSWVPSFSWPSIAGINLADWIPAFPGWPALTGTGGLIGAGIQSGLDWAKAKAANLAKKVAAAAAPIITPIQQGLHSIGLGAQGIKSDAAGEAFMTKGAQLRIIGEAGPEAVIPQKYWYAIPSWILDTLPRLGGGATVGAGATGVASSIEINITGNTILDERAARKLGKAIVTEVKNARGII